MKILRKFLILCKMFDNSLVIGITIDNALLSLVINQGSWFVVLGQEILNKSQKPKNKQHRPPPFFLKRIIIYLAIAKT